MSSIKDNLLRILDLINLVKIKNNINYDVNLMAVSKTFSSSDVAEAMEAGQTLFGENRVLEAYDKFNLPIIKEKKHSLHIIGHLQRNKVKEAIEIAEMIQSIDKIDTLDVIEKKCSEKNKKMDFLIEVNTSFEMQKYGVLVEDFDKLLEQITKKDYKFCNLRGIMTVGPLTDDKVIIKKSFKLLNDIFIKIRQQIKKTDFDIISMGMSSDFEIAISEGSNLVRIGSAIFGKR